MLQVFEAPEWEVRPAIASQGLTAIELFEKGERRFDPC
jgi:hypothetical protein